MTVPVIHVLKVVNVDVRNGHRALMTQAQRGQAIRLLTERRAIQ